MLRRKFSFKFIFVALIVVVVFVSLVRAEDDYNKQWTAVFSQAIAKSVSEPEQVGISLSVEERSLFARLVFLEAGICSYECKRYVASVVVNRLNSGKWGNSLKSVIYAPGQFTPSYLLSQTIPYRCDSKEYESSREFRETWDDCFRAVDSAILEGPCLPGYVLYFSSESAFDWLGYNVFVEKDGMFFGYLAEDKNVF